MGRSALVIALLVAGSATAQMTGPTNPSGYAPTGGNRYGQTLSPYLNLLRGGNAAVNYYYGVQPARLNEGAFQGMMNQGANGPRQTFFPTVDTLSDLSDEPRSRKAMPPSGHPIGFNNTLNYFGPTSGQSFSKNAQQRRR